MGDDRVPEEFTAVDRWGGQVMARLDDGWCAALDRGTLLCGIYETRPGLCREYEMGGSDCQVERQKHSMEPPMHADNTRESGKALIASFAIAGKA
jgi:Fe-S-cluster containining protein